MINATIELTAEGRYLATVDSAYGDSKFSVVGVGWEEAMLGAMELREKYDHELKRGEAGQHALFN